MKDVVSSKDGIPISFEVHGTQGRSLVFVHGWSCDRSYWRGQLEHFAARHRVVAVDLAGHGESGAGRERWTMAAFGDDVVAVLDALALEDVVLIGHSMGGDVITEAAVRLGSRASGLVWVDTYSRLGKPRTREQLESFLAPFRADFVTATQDLVRSMFVPDSDPQLVEWVAADMSSAPPEIALDAIEHAVGNDGPILGRLEELSAPVVAINPDHRPTDAEGLRERGVEAFLMPGVGHFLMLEDPVAFNHLLAEVVERFEVEAAQVSRDGRGG
jgi:pimeloyl-ACP methyl ester carboxylesterase